jgi:hypothetical protein
MLLADSKIINLLIPLLCDNDYQIRNLILTIIKLLSESIILNI